MFDHKAAQEALEILYASIEPLKGKYNRQIRQHIDAGSYDFALDGIADAYTASNVPMPLALFQLLDKLATDMDLASDPEFSALTEFRKTHAMGA